MSKVLEVLEIPSFSIVSLRLLVLLKKVNPSVTFQQQKSMKACMYIVHSHKAGGPQTYSAWRALSGTGPKCSFTKSCMIYCEMKLVKLATNFIYLNIVRGGSGVTFENENWIFLLLSIETSSLKQINLWEGGSLLLMEIKPFSPILILMKIYQFKTINKIKNPR